MRLKELEEKEMFNSLNNKYITEGKLSLEEAKDFRTLQNSMKISGIYDGELTSLEELQGIEIKPAKIAKPSPKEEIAQINRNELYDGIEFKDFTNDPDKLLDKQIEAQLKVNYSQEHISIVNNYGEEGFRDINKYLNGREDYRIDVNTLENKIKTLTEAIDISPPLQENSVLWRGGKLTKELKEYVNLIEKGELSVNDIEGKSCIFKSFSSTSVDRDVALDFKEEDEERWLYKILADTNTEGLHIDDYEIFSGLAEDEILIQRGYKFDVITMDLEKQELTIILRSVEL